PVTGHVRAADIDATLAKAVALGGSVVAPKFSPSPDAILALVADPEGHVVGLTETPAAPPNLKPRPYGRGLIASGSAHPGPRRAGHPAGEIRVVQEPGAL